jgi:hypothetical protein
VIKPLVFALCVMFGSGDLSAQTSSWQPSPGHTQVPIWPNKAVPDAQLVTGPEDMITVKDRLVAGRPWVAVTSVSQPTLTVYSPKGRNTGAAVVVFPGEVKGRRLGEHVFTLLEGTTGKPSQLAPGRENGRWLRVDGAGSGVTPEKLASRLRFGPEFAHKVADEIAPGTTVIVTDTPAVRKPVVDSTYFASN